MLKFMHLLIDYIHAFKNGFIIFLKVVYNYFSRIYYKMFLLQIKIQYEGNDFSFFIFMD